MPSGAHIPTLYQPIHIQPEPKKDKSPPPGAHSYDDIYSIYRGFEHTTLLASDPISYFAGLAVGAFKAGVHYYMYGAPKKIAQDGEYMDFGTKVHGGGVTAMFSMLFKKYVFGILPAVNLDKLAQLGFKDVENITNDQQMALKLASGLKHTFVFYKAAKLADEIIQRLANAADIPAK